MFIEKSGYKTDAAKKGSAKCYCDSKSGNIIYGKDVDYTYDWAGKKIPKELWGKLPVVHISFNDAMAYAKWMGPNYDIPNFEQWYAACTSGKEDYPYRYPGSNNPKAVGWYETNSGMNLMPIMTKKPNEIGIYDLAGNVCEIIKPDVFGKFKGRFRGVGGSYFNGADMMDIQSHKKQKISGWLFSKLDQTYPYMGFRCIEYLK